jgi:hypothetical protein
MSFYSSLADTPLEEFTHNNMVPFFGGGITQNLSENMNQTLLEKFTGVDDKIKIKKTEQHTFNDIQKNVYTHENSHGYLTEFDRMERPIFHNNIVPVAPIRVGPGSKFSDPVKPSGGFQQDDYRDVQYYKDIDDLRVKTNPKETFEGRVVDGLKESKRGKTGQLDKNRVDTYYEKTEKDLFRTTGAYLKEKIRCLEEVKDTNRKDAVEYQGNASRNIGNVKYGEVQESLKNNLSNYGDRNALATNVGKGSEYDYGRTNILVYNNERDITTTKTYEGNLTSYIKSMIAPITDVFRRTNKEYLVQNAREFGQIQSTLPSKPTVYNPNDKARTTIKETLIDDARLGNLKGNEKMTIHDPNDVARTTIKETLIDDARLGNLKGNEKMTIHDPNDVARTTIKETLIEDSRTGNLKGYQQITTYDPNNVARTTIKETLIHDTKLGNMTNIKKSIVYDPKEIAKVTIRDTLDNVDSTINMKGPNMQKVYDPNDIARTTVKETTIDNDVLGIVSGNNKGNGHLTNTHIAKDISRQILADNEYVGNADQQNSDGYKTANMKAKTTNKQITSDNEHYGTAGNENEAMMSYENIYNAVINQTKENTLINQAPSQNNIKMSAGSDFVNLTNVRMVCNAPESHNISRIYQEPPSTQFMNITQEKNVTTEQNCNRLDADLLKAFHNNPYTHSLNNAV